MGSAEGFLSLAFGILATSRSAACLEGELLKSVQLTAECVPTVQMLEELCRALASSVSADVGVFWEELLGGPLMAVLQDYSERGALSAQAYGVLATMSPHSMATMKVSMAQHMPSPSGPPKVER